MYNHILAPKYALLILLFFKKLEVEEHGYRELPMYLQSFDGTINPFIGLWNFLHHTINKLEEKKSVEKIIRDSEEREWDRDVWCKKFYRLIQRITLYIFIWKLT